MQEKNVLIALYLGVVCMIIIKQKKLVYVYVAKFEYQVKHIFQKKNTIFRNGPFHWISFMVALVSRHAY